MTVSVGGIALTDWDEPDSISGGGSLTSRVVQTSDGKQSLTVTGLTPKDIIVSGHMADSTGAGSAIGRVQALSNLSSSTAVGTSGLGLGQKVLVRDVAWQMAQGEVAYTLTLFVPTDDGTLGAGGGAVSQAGISDAAGKAFTRAGTPARTAAAQASALLAVGAAPRFGP